jgi:hypothetical protein
MKNVCGIAALLLAFVSASFAQTPASPEPLVTGDITGLYSFVHEGEFVQLEVTDGKVTGLISRFKDESSEKAEFVDQYFEQATLDGTTLSFRTKPVDGMWYEFSGTVERGTGKTPSDEGYWNVRGKLVERRPGADGKVVEKAHELTLKSFPADAEPNEDKGNGRKGKKE